MRSKILNKPISYEDKSKSILDGLYFGRLNPVLEARVRKWFMNDHQRNIKDEALAGIFDALVVGQTTALAATVEELAKLKIYLGLPVNEYEIINGVVYIPEGRKAVPVKKRSLEWDGRKRHLWRFAATILMPALIVSGVWFIRRIDHGAQLQPVAQEISVLADTADQSVALPDGSTARLMPGSQIRHKEGFDGSRHVELVGEARFTVVRDTVQKFTVHTEHFDIAVLGTEFKVYSPAGGNFSSIDLYHGSVDVNAGGQSIVMEPGQHLRYEHATKRVELTETAISDREYDQMPNLIFEGCPLPEIFDAIRKEYRIAIEVSEEHLPASWNNVRIDLSHARSMNELMQILSTITDGFDYDIQSDKIIIRPAI